MKLVHINLRSLLSKFDILQAEISECDYDIVAVSETWLSSAVSNDVVSIDGFRLLRRDRETGREGGVCFYIRMSL